CRSRPHRATQAGPPHADPRVQRPYTAGTQRLTAAPRTTMAIRLRAKPVRHIRCIVTSPEPKAIAFGGVPTGIMKAQLEPSAHATISNAGSSPSPAAIAASNGIIVAACAVLDVSSD